MMKTLRVFCVLLVLAVLPLSACTADIRIDSSQDSLVIANAGTLVFEGSVTIREGIEVQGGPLTIILLDGAQVQVYGAEGRAAIANNGHRLTIQCEHTGEAAHQCHSGCGSLRAVGGTDSAGIGGCSTDSLDGTNIIIRGGNICAMGGDDAAGIGGADEGDASKIQILGGRVEAIAREVEEDEPLLLRTGSGLEQSGLGAGENGYTTNIQIQNVYAWTGEEAEEAAPLNGGQCFSALTDISDQVAGKAFFRSGWPNKTVPSTGDAAPLLPAAVLAALSATVLFVIYRRRLQAN